MITVKVPPSPCLSCRRINDMASGFGKRGPKPGDYTRCYKCGHPMAFNDDLTLRNVTGKEMLELARLIVTKPEE